MTKTRSLPYQLACLRHVISAASAHVEDDVRAGAEAGLASLMWVEKNVEVIREVRRLMMEAPAIVTILREFPGARIMSREVSHDVCAETTGRAEGG